jgi:hypothetical protein
MTTFAFTELTSVDSMEVESAALGASTSTPLTDKDIGKCVKYAASSNAVVCSGSDEIQGFLVSVEPYTVNGGFGFGSIQRCGRRLAKVGANQGQTPMAFGDLVVADAQAAVGTAQNYPAVKTGTPASFKWRVIRVVSGTGVGGDVVLLESLN